MSFGVRGINSVALWLPGNASVGYRTVGIEMSINPAVVIEGRQSGGTGRPAIRPRHRTSVTNGAKENPAGGDGVFQTDGQWEDRGRSGNCPSRYVGRALCL